MTLTREHLDLLRRAVNGECNVGELIEADKVIDQLYYELDMRAAADELPTPEEIDEMAVAAGLDGDPFRG